MACGNPRRTMTALQEKHMKPLAVSLCGIAICCSLYGTANRATAVAVLPRLFIMLHLLGFRSGGYTRKKIPSQNGWLIFRIFRIRYRLVRKHCLLKPSFKYI